MLYRAQQSTESALYLLNVAAEGARGCISCYLFEMVLMPIRRIVTLLALLAAIEVTYGCNCGCGARNPFNNV